jgi:ABC-type multidrug transport system fused ATPase/permease subunit
MEGLRNVVIFLFAVFLVKNVALYIYQVSISVVEGRVTRDMRNDIYAHLLHLGFPFFQRTRTGQVISLVTTDVEQMRGIVTGNVSQADLAGRSRRRPRWWLMCGLVGGSYARLRALPFRDAGLWARLRKRLRRGVLKVLNATGEVASQVQETVSGIRLVKASGAEEWETERFRRLTRGQYKAWVRNERWRKFFPPPPR